jgi:hypothetical protein
MIAHPFPSPSGLYDAVIEALFEQSKPRGRRFGRNEINATARAVGGKEIANAGDLIYTYRYRRSFPQAVLRQPPEPKDGVVPEWALRLRGRVKGNTTYEFGPVRKHYFEPRRHAGIPVQSLPGAVATLVTEATAVLSKGGKLSDEQALLARARAADLISNVLGITSAVAFQSNKRTTHDDFGQIEIDELYIGADDATGKRYVAPIQVKTGNDKLAIVQVEQDWKWCRQYFGRAGWEVVPLGIRPLSDPAAKGALEVAVFKFALEVPAPQAVGPHGDFAAEELRYRIV